MQTYIIKRLLLAIPMLIGILFISFFVMQLAPGRPGKAGAGDARSKGLTAKQIEVMNRTFHLDKRIDERFWLWLGVMQDPNPDELKEAQARAVRREMRKRAFEKYTKAQLAAENSKTAFDVSAARLTDAEKKEAETYALAHGVKTPRHGVIFGDFGNSLEIHSVRVIDRLAPALPVTLMLNLLSFFFIYLFSVPLGIYSATHPYTAMDRVQTIGLFALHSMPNFWVAVLLIKLMVMLPDAWRLPFQGLTPRNSSELTTLEWLGASSKHLVLPLIVFTYGSFAVMSRYMRSSMMDSIRADYIRTARAKGIPESRVIYKHALRNSLIPIITLLGSELPALFSGSVVIEAIFGINGMGFVAYKALIARDYTVLMGDLTLVAMMVMLGILMSDILYRAADPRIVFEKN